jgi:hypothetical protein
MDAKPVIDTLVAEIDFILKNWDDFKDKTPAGKVTDWSYDTPCESILKLSKQLKAMLEVAGERELFCDHSVNICFCSIRYALEDAQTWINWKERKPTGVHQCMDCGKEIHKCYIPKCYHPLEVCDDCEEEMDT